jgi:hypothetical protein
MIRSRLEFLPRLIRAVGSNLPSGTNISLLDAGYIDMEHAMIL